MEAAAKDGSAESGDGKSGKPQREDADSDTHVGQLAWETKPQEVQVDHPNYCIFI